METSKKQTFDIGQFIFVEVTDDNMEAFLQIEFPGSTDYEVDEKDIKRLLLKHKVSFGYLEDTIKKVTQKLNGGTVVNDRVLVAKGIPEIKAKESILRLHKGFTKEFVIKKMVKVKEKKVSEKQEQKKSLLENLMGKEKTKEEEAEEFIEKIVEKRIPAKRTARIIDRGTIIGELCPPENGKEGKSVFGHTIFSPGNRRVVQPKRIIADKNVEEQKMDNKIRYVTTTKGTGFLVDNRIISLEEEIEGEYEIQVDDEKTKAVLILQLPKGSLRTIEYEDVINYCNESKVKYEDALDEIKKGVEMINHKEKPLIKIIIARAKEPEHGEDGYIKYHIDLTGRRRNYNKNQKIDFKELNKFIVVEKGDLVAEVIAPTKGKEDGVNVYGDIIPATRGKNAFFELTDNLVKEENRIIARKAGHIFLKKEKVYINPVLAIKGDVNYSIGNIEFNGDVIIKGDVLDDFKIVTRGRIMIEGIVGGAYLYSEKDIIIKGGVKGKNKARIISESKIQITFCESSQIEAESDVEIKKHAILTRIKSNGHIKIGDHVEGKKSANKGMILGGALVSKKGIYIHNVGNERTGNSVQLISGFDYKIAAKVKKTRAKITELQFKITKLDMEIKDTIKNKRKTRGGKRHKPTTKDIPPGLQKERKILVKTINKIIQIQNKLAREIKYEDCTGIHVVETLYPHNVLQVFDHQIKISERIKNKKFKVQNEQLVQEDIKS